MKPVHVGLGHPRRRARALLIAVLMIFTVFVAQLVRLQGIDSAAISAEAVKERAQRVTVPAARGDIVDTNGVVLARSVTRYNVTADPEAASTYKGKDDSGVEGLQAVAEAIAPIVGADTEQMLEQLKKENERGRRFMYLSKDVSPEQWNKISDLRVPGIFSETTVRREYPQGTSVAPLVGWVGPEGNGAGGVEQKDDQILRGKPGVHIYERAPDGSIIATANNTDTPAVDGRPVQLTIDNDLQWQAQNLLAAEVQRTKSVGGEAVVMDIKGNIVAAASAPSFDNNSMGTAKGNLLLRPFSEAFEPGSTMKVLTLAAALEEKKITPGTKYVVPNRLPRAGQKFRDSHDHPTEYLTTAGVVAQSSNIGTILAGERLSPKTLDGYISKFGLGEPTGVNFPGEARGQVTPHEKWNGPQRYTVMYGQGVSSTQVQQLSVFQTIANGGVREPVTLVRAVGDSNGTLTRVPEDRQSQRVVSEKTADQMVRMMEGVVHGENGTAPKAKVPGYTVAGKTGTASYYDEKVGRYNGYTASFIGFAPAEKPRYIVSVALHRPTAGSIYGGETAAPIFSKVMQAALRHGQVPPSPGEPKLLPMTYNPSKEQD